MARIGWARRGVAGMARQGAAGQGRHGTERRGKAGSAGRGPAWRGVARQARRGVARRGKARHGRHQIGIRLADPTAGKLNRCNMATKATETLAVISPPRFSRMKFKLVGTAPLVQARFSAKSMQAMKSKMEAGSTAKKGTTRKARDFDDDFQQAMHIASDGWVGVPAAALRNACIDVCRMVGFKMTHAKMSIFVEADGLDLVDGAPLIMLEAGTPERLEMATRNATGVADIRVRPMWRTWGLNPVIRFDEDQFSASDISNLLLRAGVQVGLGEGRPFSKSSNGLGFGTFDVVN